VEALEGRQLLSGIFTSPLSTPVVAVTTTQPGTQPVVQVTGATNQTGATATPVHSRSYAVVSLRNTTRATVHFEFRWGPHQAWTKYSVPAGASYYFWAYDLTGGPQVRFDADPSTGTQVAQYNLQYKAVTRTTTPTYADALHYAIAHKGQTLAVSPSAS
jgi:hypothetical protein